MKKVFFWILLILGLGIMVDLLIYQFSHPDMTHTRIFLNNIWLEFTMIGSLITARVLVNYID